MNHLGDTNKMVDTPRTDDRVVSIDGNPWVNAPFARGLERELNAANERIKRLEEAIQERDKEWFQVIESILGFHPVSMTEALHIGIERIKKQKQRIKRLEEAGDDLCANSCPTRWDSMQAANRKLKEQDAWRKAKEDKP